MLSVLRYYRVNTSRYCTHYQALTRLSAVVQLRRPAGEARSFSAGTEGAASTAAPIVSEPPMHRVCIVGSGPSGFYCAKYLLENKTVNVAVDVVEKLPVPFGLVRYGVAPDHLEVKNVTDTFAEVAKNPKFRYFGNVTVGMPGIGDVSLEALLERYSAVVLAYGAASNRELSGLWGAKDMKGVHSAREFVNWYNGHPDFVKYNDIFKLDKIRNVVIVGHGNVALDCARILTKRPDELVNSDIAEHALSALRHSTVERVTLVGRRGPVQSAFTIKEFRELTKLEGVHLVTDKTDFDRGMADPDSLAALSVKRPMKRLVDLIGTTVKSSVDYDKSDKKQIVVRYFLSPLGLLSKSALGDTHLPSGAVHPKDASINGRPLGGILDAEGQRTDGTAQSVAAVVCATNEPLPKERVQIKGFHGSGSPSSINECTSIEILPCDLLLTSVGYKSEPVSRNAAIPFDKERHVYTNIEGRISVGESFRSANGTRPLLYAAGWVAQGPTGIIISSIAGAKQTVTSIVKDLAETAARSTPEIPTDNADPADFIRDRMRSAHKAIVEWAGHERVDAEELRRGAEASPTRPRVKVVHSDEMISIANGKTH